MPRGLRCKYHRCIMQTQVDLLIVGGGIQGAGIARDAAGRGLSVALYEQDDITGGTSSASSKLIHGGLRYLETGEFRLVHDSLSERQTLLRIAPHLMQPLRFVIPHTPQLRPAWMIRLGLMFYDLLGGHQTLPSSQTVDLATSVYGEALQASYSKGFIYSDVQTDDARLVIHNLRDATERGAKVFTHMRLISAHREGAAWHARLENTQTNRQTTVVARALVNAAGTGVAALRDQLHPSEQYLGIRWVKGSHIVIPRLYPGKHAYTLQNTDRRIIFLIPWEQNYTLIGTTDIEISDASTPPKVTSEEVTYLCEAVNHYSKKPVQASDVLWQFCGTRALFDEGGQNDNRSSNASQITRDYHLQCDSLTGQAPLLSIFGGKLTTYRRVAEQALEKLTPWFPASGQPWTARAALPGGDCPLAETIGHLHASHPNLPPAWLEQLARRHGSRALALLADVRETKDLGLDFGGGLYEIEVAHFMAHEWAQEADDILWRRTKTGLHMMPEQRARFADWLASRGSR